MARSNKRIYKPPTLRDIAEKVGLSLTAVSAVLNDAPRAQGYTAATREAICSAARELGYAANPLSRALRRTHSGMIGCISFNQPDIFYGHVLRAAEERIRARGYEPVTTSLNYDLSQFETCLRRLTAWRIEGLLLMLGGRKLDGPTLRSLRELDTPILILDAPQPDGSSPSSDLNRASGRILAEHLIGLGHRSLAVLGVNKRNSHTTQRLKAIREVCRGHHIPDSECPVVYARNGLIGAHAGFRYAQEVLEKHPHVTALIGINDIFAIGAIYCLHQKGIAIPDEMSVAGFDDVCVDTTVGEENRLGAYVWPALTTVRVSHREYGIIAADVLIDHVSGKGKMSSWGLGLPPQLVSRDSTGPAPRRRG